MQKVTVSARGQIVIPAELRSRLGLSPGTTLRVYEGEGKIVLVPELQDAIGEGLGFLKRDTRDPRGGSTGGPH